MNYTGPLDEIHEAALSFRTWVRYVTNCLRQDAAQWEPSPMPPDWGRYPRER